MLCLISRYEFDVDKTLVQLQFLDENRKIRGVFNWFAVHPVSMNNTNRYVSSDNLGFAALQLEEFLNFKSLPGKVRLFVNTSDVGFL